MFEGGAARSDEAALETSVSIKDVDANLAGALHPLVASLFERFGMTGLSESRVDAELEKMKKNNVSSVRS